MKHLDQARAEPLVELDRFSRIITNLKSKNKNTKKAAEAEFAAFGDQRVELLIRFLEQDIHGRPRKLKGVVFFQVCGMLVVTIYIVAWFYLKIPSPPWLTPICLLLLAGFRATVISETRKTAVFELSRIGGTRTIGPLIDSLYYLPHNKVGPIESSLANSLHELSEIDYVCFTSARLRLLHNSLTSANADYVLAVLGILSKLGDNSLLPNVRKLASGDLIVGWQIEVQGAAQSCIHAIDQRMRQNLEESMLLRPSSVPNSNSEMLLRPHGGAVEGDPDKLLRPIEAVQIEIRRLNQ